MKIALNFEFENQEKNPQRRIKKIEQPKVLKN